MTTSFSSDPDEANPRVRERENLRASVGELDMFLVRKYAFLLAKLAIAIVLVLLLSTFLRDLGNRDFGSLKSRIKTETLEK